MKLITNLEEKHSIVSMTFTGNIVNRLREDEPKYYQKFMDSYVVFLLDSGRFLVHEIEVQKIRSTIMYDDETPRPEVNEETFMEYNLAQYEPLRGYEGKRLFIYESQDKTYLRIAPNAYEEPIRIATDEETKVIMELRTEANEAYLKRLKTHYKRYKDKIRTSGYWKNR